MYPTTESRHKKTRPDVATGAGEERSTNKTITRSTKKATAGKVARHE